MQREIKMTEMTDEQKLSMTKACMRVLDTWKVTPEFMSLALSLEGKEGTARNFQKYRAHKAFPESAQTYRCADYVLRIDGAMQTTYPVNSAMSERWLRINNRRLGTTPLNKIAKEGENGLIASLAELDCNFCFDLTNPI